MHFSCPFCDCLNNSSPFPMFSQPDDKKTVFFFTTALKSSAAKERLPLPKRSKSKTGCQYNQTHQLSLSVKDHLHSALICKVASFGTSLPNSELYSIALHHDGARLKKFTIIGRLDKVIFRLTAEILSTAFFVYI